MKKIDIYTDGACSGNPGLGGWGAVLIYNNKSKEFAGFNELTTNNQMEMTAVIEAVKHLKEPCEIDIYSDSAYVCNAFNQKWIDNWVKNGWRTANKKPVMNMELWKELIEVLAKHKFTFNKVKGHADNELNNRCDFLATNQIVLNKKES